MTFPKDFPPMEVTLQKLISIDHSAIKLIPTDMFDGTKVMNNMDENSIFRHAELKKLRREAFDTTKFRNEGFLSPPIGEAERRKKAISAVNFKVRNAMHKLEMEMASSFLREHGYVRSNKNLPDLTYEDLEKFKQELLALKEEVTKDILGSHLMNKL